MSEKVRCAIYTRKSTEEGLEQDFNSLDAQREACEAYVKSQKGLGWTVLAKRYDDGGISGGTMDRPALQDLLADIDGGRVDLVIVYKVDRLTRSLMDFARIIEAFDAKSVSFVSVTQQFNTANSMGRLTLNVLLSFAQFEREVTAERIRDKIAASKRKGMWMGGLPPLGYDNIDRKLVINESEAETVRELFRLYLEFGNVTDLKREADRLNLKTKDRTPNNGRRKGLAPFTRGHIYKLLSNPVYIGKVAHKEQMFEGEHEAIIDQEAWDRVQRQLAGNAVQRRSQVNARSPSLLAGLIRDECGNPLSSSHATKGRRRYRYYVSRKEERNSCPEAATWRLPASEIENLVVDQISTFLGDGARLLKSLGNPSASAEVALKQAREMQKRISTNVFKERRETMLCLVKEIVLQGDHLEIVLNAASFTASGFPRNRETMKETASQDIRVEVPVAFRRRGVEMRLVVPGLQSGRRMPDPGLVTLIADAWRWFEDLTSGRLSSVAGIVDHYGVDQGDVSRALSLAFLAPDLVNAILEGRQPVELTVSRMKRMSDLPADWTAQWNHLGLSR